VKSANFYHEGKIALPWHGVCFRGKWSSFL
jgi:hypothetical protein